MSYVITRLKGGLGNQLFQYATGSTLASRLGVPHLLDRTFLDQRGPNVTWTPRELELDVLQAPLEFATADQVHRARRELDGRWYRLLHRALPFIRSRCLVERDRLYDPRLAERTPPVYLDGYWQNERYFATRANELRNRLFVPRDRPSEHNTAVLASIRSTVSASLHIRRGDYVSLESASAYHGTCTLEYYSSGARHLAEHVGVERFFIFSDDPDWVQANLRLPYPVEHISHNRGSQSHWDLFLMKHCRHHIIANSSFSWWGAWLNSDANKVVIAPKQWFAEPSVPHDIIPPTWLAR